MLPEAYNSPITGHEISLELNKAHPMYKAAIKDVLQVLDEIDNNVESCVLRIGVVTYCDGKDELIRRVKGLTEEDA